MIFEKTDKILGNWINEGACQDFGEGKICAALQLQVRSCQDGKTDKCTQQETFRLIPCRQDETENICDGNNLYALNCIFLFFFSKK